MQESDIEKFREVIKQERERLRESDDPTAQAMASAIDTFLLVSYNPDHLVILLHILKDYMNTLLGGEN